MKTISGPLKNAQQAKAFIDNYIWPRIKQELIAGNPLRISVKDDTRTLEQNAKFHALCSDISKSGFLWAGKKRTPAQWKVLLVSAHAHATKDGADLVRGIEGEYVNLRESTALMSIKRSSSLIEYAIAFMAMNDIPIQEPEPDWPV